MPSILSARFYNALWTASAERDKFEGVIDDEGVNVPAWVKHERSIMLKTVNEERARRGLPPVSERTIKHGEHVGDSEYGPKLAEHCARLIEG